MIPPKDPARITRLEMAACITLAIIMVAGGLLLP